MKKQKFNKQPICDFCGKKITRNAEKIGDKWYHGGRCWHEKLAQRIPLTESMWMDNR